MQEGNFVKKLSNRLVTSDEPLVFCFGFKKVGRWGRTEELQPTLAQSPPHAAARQMQPAKEVEALDTAETAGTVGLVLAGENAGISAADIEASVNLGGPSSVDVSRETKYPHGEENLLASGAENPPTQKSRDKIRHRGKRASMSPLSQATSFVHRVGQASENEGFRFSVFLLQLLVHSTPFPLQPLVSRLLLGDSRARNQNLIGRQGLIQSFLETICVWVPIAFNVAGVALSTVELALIILITVQRYFLIAMKYGQFSAERYVELGKKKGKSLANIDLGQEILASWALHDSSLIVHSFRESQFYSVRKSVANLNYGFFPKKFPNGVSISNPLVFFGRENISWLLQMRRDFLNLLDKEASRKGHRHHRRTMQIHEDFRKELEIVGDDGQFIDENSLETSQSKCYISCHGFLWGLSLSVGGQRGPMDKIFNLTVLGSFLMGSLPILCRWVEGKDAFSGTETGYVIAAYAVYYLALLLNGNAFILFNITSIIDARRRWKYFYALRRLLRPSQSYDSTLGHAVHLGPRIDFHFVENVQAFVKMRDTLVFHGIRQQSRLQAFVSLCLIFLGVLWTFVLVRVFSAHEFVMDELFVTALASTVFVGVCAGLNIVFADATNTEPLYFIQAITAQSIAISADKVELLKQTRVSHADEDEEEDAKRCGDNNLLENAKLDAVLDSLQHVIEYTKAMDELYPLKFLGIRADYKSLSAILALFGSILVALFRIQSSG